MARVEQAGGREYRPIADYGAIGDGRSVALVASDGGIDWWCPGRFDAPSVFARVLDRERGGHFALHPALPASSRLAYAPDTNVLVARHVVGHARAEVMDLLVPPEVSGVRESVLVRRVRAEQGLVDMEAVLAPRFQYGRALPRFGEMDDGMLVRGGGQVMHLSGVVAWERGAGARVGHFTLDAGETRDLVLRHSVADDPAPFERPLPRSVDAMIEGTLARWRAWAARVPDHGAYAPAMRRAALAIKLLQHEGTGAFVAAATASLPEEVGGERNWDYRFTWLRDGAWSAHALHKLGYHEDAERFRAWCHVALGEPGDPARVLYTIDALPDAPELELNHLDGYRRSRPVRIGNGAIHQHQLDVYGETVDFLLRDVEKVDEAQWARVRGLVDRVAATWREPDSGIWEMRSEPRHFVLSKAMAWVALSLGAQVARRDGFAGDVDAWEREAALVREEVLREGYCPEKDSFVQAYGTTALDASNLLLPLIGFVDARDPRMMGTVDATVRELVVNGLVYRYRGVDDGLMGHEATFAYCTFWLIEVLALQGRAEQARELFERMLAHATPLGLYAEEIDARSGLHLGNFPQAFPHIGLIHAALALRALEAEAAPAPAPAR